MKFHPINNQILIKRRELAKKSKGGIILPGTAEFANVTYGQVVAVPEGETAIKAGDFIAYNTVKRREVSIAGNVLDVVVNDKDSVFGKFEIEDGDGPLFENTDR
jgi:co-chaperonin GroES (HSP10)